MTKKPPFRPVENYDPKIVPIGGARDRTVLQKLSFSDPDKGDPLHDLGCLYIAEKSVEVVQMVAPDSREIHWVTPEKEHHLVKGVGQYATTIGFIDVKIIYQATETVEQHGTSHERTSIFGVGVEVKVNPVPVGDLIRQLKLYDEYALAEHDSPETSDTRRRGGLRAYGLPEQRKLRWVVAPTYKLDAASLLALRAEGFRVLQLGAKFKKWCDKLAKSTADEVPEL